MKHFLVLYGLVDKNVFCWKVTFNAGSSHTSDVINRLAIEINTVTTAYLESKDRYIITRSHKYEEQVQIQGCTKDGDLTKLKQARRIMSKGSSYDAGS